MTNSKERNTLKLTSSERERFNYLHDIAVDGDDAEAVLKYASKMLKEAEQNVLNCIVEPNAPLADIAAEYRLIKKFHDMLVASAQKGERYKQKIKTMQK